MILPGYIQQRAMDDRWRHLLHMKGELQDSEESRTAAEWQRTLCTPTGWDARAAVNHFGPQHRLTATKFTMHCMNNGLMTLDPTFHPTHAPIPKKCDACEASCQSECMCGEAFCSRACMQKEWKNHRAICEQIWDNNMIALMLNQMEFSKFRSDVDMEACLGQPSRKPPRRTTVLPPDLDPQGYQKNIEDRQKIQELVNKSDLDPTTRDFLRSRLQQVV